MSDSVVAATDIIESYPKVWNLGHRAIADLFKGTVHVEEKVDGSQFSFRKDADGVVHCRSRNKGLVLAEMDASDMFQKAVTTAVSCAENMVAGWTYRGEYLSKPKHNVLAYDRVPEGNVVVWDIQTGPGQFLPPEYKRKQAELLGLECVPAFFTGSIDDAEQFQELLKTPSFLGGLMEGVVIKNYDRFGEDGKILCGKFVADKFREVAKGDWKDRHPSGSDIKERLLAKYRSDARWHKALQHLKERGEATGALSDIGLLMKEVKEDTLTECLDAIKEDLWQWAKADFVRRLGHGIPEWYKDLLMKEQFECEPSC
jgi:hypothetical protein